MLVVLVVYITNTEFGWWVIGWKDRWGILLCCRFVESLKALLAYDLYPKCEDLY